MRPVREIFEALAIPDACLVSRGWNISSSPPSSSARHNCPRGVLGRLGGGPRRSWKRPSASGGIPAPDMSIPQSLRHRLRFLRRKSSLRKYHPQAGRKTFKPCCTSARWIPRTILLCICICIHVHLQVHSILCIGDRISNDLFLSHFPTRLIESHFVWNRSIYRNPDFKGNPWLPGKSGFPWESRVSGEIWISRESWVSMDIRISLEIQGILGNQDFQGNTDFLEIQARVAHRQADHVGRTRYGLPVGSIGFGSSNP